MKICFQNIIKVKKEMDKQNNKLTNWKDNKQFKNKNCSKNI